jgi:uncharacterized protein VirK/YbjX
MVMKPQSQLTKQQLVTQPQSQLTMAQIRHRVQWQLLRWLVHPHLRQWMAQLQKTDPK